MKTKIIFIISLLSISLHSCEEIIPMEDDFKGFQGLVINAIATTDTVFMASVSTAYLPQNAPYILPRIYGLDDREYFMAIYQGIDFLSGGQYDIDSPELIIRDSVLLKQYMLKDAEVKLTVNNQTDYPMSYHPQSMNYISSYRPQTGDNLRISVKGIEQEASAETTILKPQLLEVINYEKIFQKKEKENLSGVGYEIISTLSDTIVRMTLRITDPAHEKNYYRLKIRASELLDNKWIHNDVFYSSDLIFQDSRLVRSWIAWQPFMSNVFDDYLINGKEHLFTAECRMCRFGNKSEDRRITIELQSIPEDYYHYLKSMMIYRITSDDDFSEDIYIHSNVENGWGIVGSLSSEKHIIELN